MIYFKKQQIKNLIEKKSEKIKGVWGYFPNFFDEIQFFKIGFHQNF